MVGSEKSLDELGIVSGDLLHVIYKSVNKKGGLVPGKAVVNKLAGEAAATTNSSNMAVAMDISAGSSHRTSPSVHNKLFSHLALGSHLHELEAELSGAANNLNPSQVVTRALHAIMRDCGMMDSVSKWSLSRLLLGLLCCLCP